MTTEHILQDGSFTGFKQVEPVKGDWIKGVETGISGAPQNVSGDWRPLIPVEKTQLMVVNGVSYGDTESCTNFSGTNDVAVQLQYLVDTNQVPDAALAFLKSNGYFDPVLGKINLSARHSAITSGTTGADGNTLPNVWQTMTKVGVVPYADCPDPTAEWEAKINSGAYSVHDLWNIWFDPSAVTTTTVAKGLEFLTYFQIQYHWVVYTGTTATPQVLQQDLQISPLQIATAVCPGWNTTDPIQGCGIGYAHATTMLNIESQTYFDDILDHYVPYQKQFAADYIIAYAMQGVVTPATAPITYPAPADFKYTFTAQLDLGASGEEVIALQNVLKMDGEFPLTVQSTGYFGTVTQLALEKFQAKYGIVTEGTPETTGYGRVGPATLEKLNALFSK